MYTQIGQIGSYMIIKKLKEDIFHAFMNHDFDIFVQGCNCHHTQGAGIAALLSSRYPEVLIADRTSVKGDPSKLGSYTLAKTLDGIVINAYTQYSFGAGGPHVDYDAISKVFATLNAKYKDQNVTFGIPAIGCGLAGGNWEIVEQLINDCTPDINIIYYYI